MLWAMPLIKKSSIFCFFCLCFLITHCRSFTKKAKTVSFSEDQINQMDQALVFMQNQEFLNGAKTYDELSQALKDSSSQSLMLFNAGVAYKEAGQCDKALLRLRKLLDRSLKDPSFKARGLMEISYIYECLGDEELVFLSLKDAGQVRVSLPWILNQVVYPARLAMAYARLGQISKAEHYKSLSLTKILQSKTAFSSEQELSEQVSRMFYLMGRSYVKKEHIQPEAFFKAFPYHQLFLLQSLFFKHKTWSDLSQKELENLFDKLLFAVRGFKDKHKYKKLLEQAMQNALVLIRKEKSKKWESFYSKKSDKVLRLLSKSS